MAKRADSSPSASSSSSDHSSSNKVRSLLSKAKRRRARAYDITKEDEEAVDALIKAMDDAYSQDVDANQRGLPALRKMLLLKKVVSLLKAEKFQELFLEMNGCLVLARWLSPLPDGCFPHTKILTDVLTALSGLGISTEHLQAVSVGRAVMVVAESVEDIQVRKLAHALVDKWSRQIYDITTNWASLDPEVADREPSDLPRPETNLHRLIQTDTHTGQVRVPEKNQFDFKYKPQSKGKDVVGVADNLLPKFLLRRTKVKTRKPQARMSADGKGLISG